MANQFANRRAAATSTAPLDNRFETLKKAALETSSWVGLPAALNMPTLAPSEAPSMWSMQNLAKS